MNGLFLSQKMEGMKDKPLIDKSFKNWTREDLQTCLGLTRQKKFKVLTDWLNMEVDLTKEEIDFLETSAKKR